MITFLIILNLTFMAVVFGYAVSASAVSHPAMMASAREVAVGFFDPFFHKSAHFQLVVALLVLAVSLALSLLGAGWLWVIGGAVLQLSGPYTIKILMPLNNRIMNKSADIHSEQMGRDLAAWGGLHMPRTVLAGVVFVLFAYLATQGGM